jgi:hypothetical protein
MTQPHTHDQPTQQTPEEGSGWTSYAAVKYGFIFLIVLAILWFVGEYVLGVF